MGPRKTHTLARCLPCPSHSPSLCWRRQPAGDELTVSEICLWFLVKQGWKAILVSIRFPMVTFLFLVFNLQPMIGPSHEQLLLMTCWVIILKKCGAGNVFFSHVRHTNRFDFQWPYSDHRYPPFLTIAYLQLVKSYFRLTSIIAPRKICLFHQTLVV